MTLRSKLNALVILAVLLAVGPYAVYTAVDSSEKALATAMSDFRRVGSMAVEVIREGYREYVVSQVASAVRLKTAIRGAARLLSRLSDDLSALDPETIAGIVDRQLLELRRQGLLMVRLSRRGEAIGSADSVLGEIDWREVKDITGQSLVDKMASDAVSPEGDFSMIRLPVRVGLTDVWFLALLRPEGDGSSFSLSLSGVKQIKRRSDLRSDKIVGDLAERLSFRDLPAGSSVVLYDARTMEPLTAKGVPFEPKLMPSKLMFQAESEGSIEAVHDFSTGVPYLVRLDYFRPLDWHFAMIVPQADVTSSVKRTL
jgi:hypothetical protein